MKRWSPALAVLSAFTLVAPAANAQNTTYPSITTTTSYTNTANGSQGSHRWSTKFQLVFRDLLTLDLTTNRAWTPAVGHTVTQLKQGNVYDDQQVNYEDTDLPACLQHTAAPDPTTQIFKRFTQCQGTLAYYAWSALSEELPSGSVWNLPAGRHFAQVTGGNVYRWVSADRRTLWITHVNTKFPEPDQPHEGSLWPEDLAGGGSGSVVEDGGFATFSNGGLCRWRTDSSTPKDPVDYYINAVHSTCVNQEVEAVDTRCVARIVAPEDNKRDRDEVFDHQLCTAVAELSSSCKVTGPVDSPCGNFAMYRHWWWTLLNRSKRWTSGCFRDEGIARPLNSEIYRNAAGRSVLHCWTHRFGSRWLLG